MPDAATLARTRELYAQQKRGEIMALEVWPAKVRLAGAFPFRATYSYKLTDGTPVWETLNVKASPRFKDVRRMWRVYGPGLLVVTTRRRGTRDLGRTVMVETIEGGGG